MSSVLISEWCVAARFIHGGFSSGLYAAIFLSLLMFLGMIIWNIQAFVRFLPKPTRFGYRSDIPRTHMHSKDRASELSTQAWLTSVIGFWVGPLLLLTAPAAIGMALWEWRRLRRGEVSERSWRPVKMALVNAGAQSAVALLIGILYVTT